MPKVVSTKLLYISSMNRSFGTLEEFGINIDAQYTKLDDNRDYVSIGLVDCEIRSTWYNVRSSNNKFFLVNYDSTLAAAFNAAGGVSGVEIRPNHYLAGEVIKPVFYTGPGTRGWYDTPNYQLITIEEGNYNILELASAIQNALNAYPNPDSRFNECLFPAYEGGTPLGQGSSWGTNLVWAVTWNEKTGRMTFEYSGGVAETDLCFDFRTLGDFNRYSYGQSAAFTGAPGATSYDAQDIDTQLGAFELLGFDRSGFQINQEQHLVPYPYNISSQDAPIGPSNTGGVPPYLLPSPHPCQIGAPTAIYLHSNLPSTHISGQRRHEMVSEGTHFLDAERLDIFTGSSIFAKVINTYQWYSLIPFQSQGEDDYKIYMKDLRYINNLRFWITDQFGYKLFTQHEWSLTIKWKEVRDDTGEQNAQLKEQTELLKLLLIQGEKNKILPEPSKKLLSVGNIWKTKRERMESEAKHKVKEQTAKEETDAMVHKRKEDELEKMAAHKDVFGDEGSKVKSGDITPDNDTSWWVRKPQPTGDGGPLFKGENHFYGVHGVNYSYAGPGTKFKTRQARGDKGINPLDAAAIPHDRVYGNPLATPEEVEMADLQLQQKAAEIAEKYPEIRQDAKVVSGLFDIKDIGVNMGWVDRMMFAKSKKR